MVNLRSRPATVGLSAVGLHLQALGEGALERAGAPGCVGASRRRARAGHRPRPAPVVDLCLRRPQPDPIFPGADERRPARAGGAVRARMKELEPQRSVYDIAVLDEPVDGAALRRLLTLLLVASALGPVPRLRRPLRTLSSGRAAPPRGGPAHGAGGAAGGQLCDRSSDRGWRGGPRLRGRGARLALALAPRAGRPALRRLGDGRRRFLGVVAIVLVVGSARVAHSGAARRPARADERAARGLSRRRLRGRPRRRAAANRSIDGPSRLSLRRSRGGAPRDP